MPEYRTVSRKGRDEVVISKSRFIGEACPCTTEEEALAFLNEAKTRYRDARHHCYAYILGANRGIMRYSDDGEPGGTAGLPIVETMQQRGVTNVCVVVTRYFGGILLGTGGLTRAYRLGCKAALDASGVVTMIPSVTFLCEVSYPLWDRLNHALGSLPVRVERTDFAASVEAVLTARTADADRVREEIVRLCQGRCEFLDLEEKEMPWEDPPGEEGADRA